MGKSDDTCPVVKLPCPCCGLEVIAKHSNKTGLPIKVRDDVRSNKWN